MCYKGGTDCWNLEFDIAGSGSNYQIVTDTETILHLAFNIQETFQQGVFFERSIMPNEKKTNIKLFVIF